jgi:hypothetical protein
MQDLGKVLLLIGGIIALFGVLLTLSGKIPFIGKLPGDIFIKKDNVTFYLPVVTSIVLSLILTVLLNLFNRR